VAEPSPPPDETAELPIPEAKPETETEPELEAEKEPEVQPKPQPVPAPGFAPVAGPVVAIAPATEPTSTAPSGHGRLVLAGAVLLGCCLIAGAIGMTVHNFFGAQDGATPSNTVASSAAAATEAATRPSVELAANARAIDGLSARLDKLSEQLATLSGRIEQVERAGASKPDLPREFSDLRTQVEQLSARTSELAPLADDVKRVDRSMAKFVESLKSLRDELVVVRVKAETAAVASAPAPGPERPADDPGSGASEDARYLAQGMKLFKQNRFKEALGVFNRLELTSPDDARVWYFAALSHGFATGQWSGGTERLVEKGIERERAGTPGTQVIDAAFSELSPAQGRDWITEYRRRGAVRNEVQAPNPNPMPSSSPARTPPVTPTSTG